MLRRQIAGCSLGVLIGLLVPETKAQTMTCTAPRADAPDCRRFHYHLRSWQMATRTTSTEVSATTNYASQTACDAARTQAQKASQTLAEQMKISKIDGKFEADTFGDCHCDQTEDPSSRSFLDDATRLRQRLAWKDIKWQMRAKLLGSDSPHAQQLLTSTMPQRKAFDRFLTEKLTALSPPDAGDVKPLPLLATHITASAAPPSIARNVVLLQLDAPAAPPVPPLNPATPEPPLPVTQDPPDQGGRRNKGNER